ncbi:MAG: SDR family oxidoreductase [Gemmatimonadota bacterium]
MPSLAKGSTALVTGASRGIGFAVARALRARDVRVIMVARSRDRLERAAAEIGGTPLAADLASHLHLDRLADQVLEHFGDAPDMLVNAAGAFTLAPVAQTRIEDFDELIAANLRAPFVVIRTFLPHMLVRASGHIVSIGSVAGRQAFAANGAYSASKFGLRGLHEVLEVELKGTGVRATLIEPAATDTPIWDSVDYAANPGLPQRAQMLAPEMVADAVLFALEQADGSTVKYIGIERS